jgi:multidrug resistance protein, MATE family
MEMTAARGATVDTRGNPYSVILKLAAPTMLAMMSQSVVNEVDLYFVGRLGGCEATNAQAALLPSLILFWAFGGSLSAISVGTQALTARRVAEGKTDEAGAVLANAAFFGLIAGLIFTLAGYLSLPFIIHKIIKNPTAAEYALSYSRYRFAGIMSVAVTFAFKAFFDGLGKTFVHMVSALVMNALNIVLCLIFIFGKLGAPRMGLSGAGLAALASTWVGLLIMLVYGVLPEYRRTYRWIDRKKLNWPLTRDILRLAVPGGVATLALMVGFGFFLFVVGKIDAAAPIEGTCGGKGESVSLAATALIIGVMKLTFTACLAFGTATATLVGQSLGEKSPQNAVKFGWASVRLGLLIFGIVGILEGLLFTPQILHFFNHEARVVATALVPMRMMGTLTPAIAVAMILTQALFGAGSPRFVMIVEIILHFTCLMPLAWLFGVTLNRGLVGIWMAGVVYVLALAGAMVWKFAKGDWKENVI